MKRVVAWVGCRLCSNLLDHKYCLASRIHPASSTRFSVCATIRVWELAGQETWTEWQVGRVL